MQRNLTIIWEPSIATVFALPKRVLVLSGTKQKGEGIRGFETMHNKNTIKIC